MNDLEVILSCFDSLDYTSISSTAVLANTAPKQKLYLDVVVKANYGDVLVERWTFTLSLAPNDNSSSNK